MMKIYDIISEVWTEIGDALALVPRSVWLRNIKFREVNK